MGISNLNAQNQTDFLPIQNNAICIMSVRTILQHQNFAKTVFFLTILSETRKDVNFHTAWIVERENSSKNLKLEWILVVQELMVFLTTKIPQSVENFIFVTKVKPTKCHALQHCGSTLPSGLASVQRDCYKLIQFFLIPPIVSFFSLVSLKRIPTNLDVPKAKFLTQSVLLAKNQKMYPNVDVGMIVAKNQVAPELVMQIVLALSNSYLIMMMFKNIV